MKTPSLKKNAILKIILNICNIIIPLIVGPYVLRILDRPSYDLFNNLSANFQFFLIIGGLGLYNYGVREISKMRNDKEKCSKFFSETFIIGLISNLIMFLAFVVFLYTTSIHNLEVVISLVLCIQFLGNIFNFEWVNEAREEFKFIAIKSILIRVIYLVSIFLLVKVSTDIVWYVFLIGISAFLNTFVSFLHIRRFYHFTFKNLCFRNHFIPMLLIFIIANVNILYSQLDRMMLANFAEDSEGTIYQISLFISGTIRGVLLSIVTVSIPRLTNFWNDNNKEDFKTLYRKIVKVFCFFAFPALIGLFCLSEEVILIYGGQKYLDCVIALKIFSIAQIFGSFNYILGEALLYPCNCDKKLVFINLIGGIVNLTLNFGLLFFKVLDATTVIYTLSISYIVVNILCLIFVKKKLQLKINLFNKDFFKYLILSLLFIPITYFLKSFNWNLYLFILVDIIACFVIYFVGLFILRDEYLVKIIKRN